MRRKSAWTPALLNRRVDGVVGGGEFDRVGAVFCDWHVFLPVYKISSMRLFDIKLFY
jgi:hypothetical protein